MARGRVRCGVRRNLFRRRMARRAAGGDAAGRPSGRHHRRIVLSRRLQSRRAEAERASGPRCRSMWRARRSSSSTTCSIPGAACARRSTSCSTSAGPRRSSSRCWSTVAAASCRSSRRTAGTRRRSCVARPVDSCSSATTGNGSSLALEASSGTDSSVEPQSAAQPRRRAQHLLTLEGLPAGDHHADPRHRRAVRRHRRARGEESAAAARQDDLQPVLRELDADADDVRDRRQATVRRRDQPEHRRVVDVARARRCSTPSTTWSR